MARRPFYTSPIPRTNSRTSFDRSSSPTPTTEPQRPTPYRILPCSLRSVLADGGLLLLQLAVIAPQEVVILIESGEQGVQIDRLIDLDRLDPPGPEERRHQ